METIILLPVYNDWHSLDLLLLQLESCFSKQTSVVVIDDGSSEKTPTAFQSSLKVTVIKLTQNLGHQKAIAIGLSYIHEHLPPSHILIMDADGNDLPTDAALLYKTFENNAGKIILAKRKKRKESPAFQLMYFFYLIVFRLLTGKNIRYGNFCIIPYEQVLKIIHLSNIWLHLPASIVKSKFPYVEVSIDKGKRLQGKSKMNTSDFFIHGLGAIAVFTDIIAIRLLIASLTAIGISLLSLAAIVTIRLGTELAIPGWASAIGSSLIIIILLSLLISLFLIFVFIISQSSRKFIPAIHYKDYVYSTKQMN